MKKRLALSAEEIEENLAPEFEGVGLLRGEYLCRKINEYVTLDSCLETIQTYLERIASLFAPFPVWYRTTEMETAEVNVLAGVDKIIEEKNTMLGYRGIRRGVLIPDAFLRELSAVTEVARRHANLHILIPYIYDPSELAFVKDCLQQTGFPNELGIMAEIPSAILCLDRFLDMGVTNITVGMNDLTSLVLGVYRGSGLDDHFHPAVEEMLKRAREITAARGVPLSVAGYFSREFMERAESIGFDYSVIHYSRLPEVMGPAYANLPDLQNLTTIKLKTRSLIRQRAIRTAVAEWKKEHQQG